MKKLTQRILLGMILVFGIVSATIGYGNKKEVKAAEKFSVHYIDVGAGDAALLQYGTGSSAKYAMIDAGPLVHTMADGTTQDKSTAARDYLLKHGVKELEYILVTHPHVDHYGGFTAILAKESGINVKTIYYDNSQINLNNPGFTADENIFEKETLTEFNKFLEERIQEVRDSGDENNFVLKKPEVGQKIKLGSASMEILGPVNTNFAYGRSVDLTIRQVNKYSIVSKITYGKNTFLMTGDTQKEAVEAMIADGKNLKAQVVKASHHGAQDVTDEEKVGNYPSDHKLLYDTAEGAIAIIPNGYNNKNNTPHSRTLKALKDYSSYATSDNGSIVVTSDGTKLTVTGSKSSTPIQYGDIDEKSNKSRLFSSIKIKSNGKTLDPGLVSAANTYKIYEKKTITVKFRATANSFTTAGQIYYKKVNRGVSNNKVSWKKGSSVKLSNNFAGRLYVRIDTPAGSTVMKLPGLIVDTKAPTSTKIKGSKSGIKNLNTSSKTKSFKRIKKSIKLSFSAKYGKSGESKIQYKIVPYGKKQAKYKWKTKSSLTYKKKNKWVRVYVRFTDKSGNKTTRKTNVFAIR